jgi:hypothetical protein
MWSHLLPFFFLSLSGRTYEVAHHIFHSPQKNLIVVWKKHTKSKRNKVKILVVRRASFSCILNFLFATITCVCPSLSLVYNGLAYTSHASGKFPLPSTIVCKLCRVIALSRGSVVSAVQYTKASRREIVYFTISRYSVACSDSCLIYFLIRCGSPKISLKIWI